MKSRIAIAYVASLLLGALLPLEVTLADALEAYVVSGDAQQMCQAEATQSMSLASAPCVDTQETLPCMSVAGDVEKPDAMPVALLVSTEALITLPVLAACDPTPEENIGGAPQTGGLTTLSHIQTIVLRV